MCPNTINLALYGRAASYKRIAYELIRVCFGALADICSAKSHVCFIPESGPCQNTLKVRQKASSLRRCHTQDPPRRIVGQQVERTVRPLPHVADAFIQPLQQALFFDHLAILDLES